MNPRVECISPGSARVSRAGDRVLAITDFERSLRRDVATSTREACATQSSFDRDLSDPV